MRRIGLELHVYHIVPDKDGAWELRLAPRGDIVGRYALKSEAIAHGQKRVREHDFAQLIVHKLDYTIEREWTHLVEDESEPEVGAAIGGQADGDDGFDPAPDEP